MTSEPLGNGFQLSWQRHPSGQVRAVIRNAQGVIEFRGPMVQEPWATTSRQQALRLFAEATTKPQDRCVNCGLAKESASDILCVACNKSFPGGIADLSEMKAVFKFFADRGIA